MTELEKSLTELAKEKQNVGEVSKRKILRNRLQKRRKRDKVERKSRKINRKRSI